MVSYLCCISQDHYPRVALPTPIVKKSAPQTCLQTNLMEAFCQLKFLFPDNSSLWQTDPKLTTTSNNYIAPTVCPALWVTGTQQSWEQISYSSCVFHPSMSRVGMFLYTEFQSPGDQLLFVVLVWNLRSSAWLSSGLPLSHGVFKNSSGGCIICVYIFLPSFPPLLFWLSALHHFY